MKKMFKEDEITSMLIYSSLDEIEMKRIINDGYILGYKTIGIYLEKIEDLNKVKNIDVDYIIIDDLSIISYGQNMLSNMAIKLDYNKVNDELIRQINSFIFIEYNLNINNYEKELDKLSFLDSIIDNCLIIRFENFKINSDNLYKYDQMCLFIDQNLSDKCVLSLENFRKYDLYNHPCLMHACSTNSCHIKYYQLPLNIKIDSQKNILLEYSSTDIKIGNYKDNLFDSITTIDKHKKLYKKLYLKYIYDYMYYYLPINIILNDEVKEGYFV